MEQFQELLVRNALIASLYLLAMTSQWTFYRRTGEAFLRMGAIALAFGLVAEIARSVAPGVPGATLVSQLSDIGFCVFVYAVLVNVVREKASLVLIGSTAAAMSVLVIGFQLSDASDQVSVLSKVPGAMLLLFGIYRVGSKVRTSPGTFFLGLMVCLHTLFYFATPFLSGMLIGDILTAYLNALIVLLIGSVLPLISAERIMSSLRRQEQKLGVVQQEKKRLEVQITQAQKHESLGVLAGGIAHDFNNMLTSILGYSSLAMNKLSPDSEARKDLFMVMSGARQAVELTSQMLAYAGKSAIEFEPVNLSSVVDELSDLVTSIVPKKIRLVRKMASGLPLVRSDPVQMSQVIMNLVANGVDAIQHGEGVIEIATGLADVSSDEMSRCWFAEEHEAGAFVYLRVSDSGVGIEQNQLARIFDPFYSEKSQGRGLGLSSLSGIVRQHKGFIAVDSSPGEGSIFTVYFPVVAFRDGEPADSDQASPARMHNESRILLADDDPRIRSLIVSILEAEGFETVDVEDGREAARLALSKDQQFDLLLLDCTMPKKSGPEVYRDVRGAGSQVPVLLISGYQQEQVLTDVTSDERAGFLKKPFNIDELTELVKTMIAAVRTEKS